MKVLVRSDRIPIVLMISGLSMATVSQMSFVESNQDLLFSAGWVIGGTGFLIWAIPSLMKYYRKKERARKRAQQRSNDEISDSPRRYARPRR